MINILKNKFIPKDKLKDWTQYSNNLSNYPLVKKYLSYILKKWVENVQNPLEIQWIKSLWNDRFQYLENRLDYFENEIEKEILIEVLNELKNINHKEPEEISKKINSLESEIEVFNMIKDKCNKIVKIHEIGDWKCDNKIIHSVKQIAKLDLNYSLIEKALRGLFYIKENSLLRNFSSIKVLKGKNIDDKFLKNVLVFIREYLVIILRLHDKIMANNISLFNEQKTFMNNKYGRLEIKSTAYNKNGQLSVIFDLIEHRFCNIKQKNALQILFEKKPGNYLFIFADSDAFWNGEKFDWKILKSRIDVNINKFDKAFIKLNKNNDRKEKFVAWINIIVHPKYETYIKNKKKEIKNILISHIGNIQNYEVIILFTFQWNFTSTPRHPFMVRIGCLHKILTNL